ncbi:MAG: 2-oxoacid:acceptor oxidoreductase family protein [Phycisphaerae bacterium]|nr:2-oxoacid:acceptor oxidoreductase family protein [Phycisphaerae bacterium]
MYEIRWHGRGGQGAVTAATLLAEAAYLHEGYAGVAAAPSFGAERRGAPVVASARIDSEPILRRSQVTRPDIVVVLDETLLDVVDVTVGIKAGGTVIINTANGHAADRFSSDLRIGLSDATAAAQEMGLVAAGSVVVNTAILGAFCRATGLITIDNMTKAIRAKFGRSAGDRNAQAAHIAYEGTRIREPKGR